MSWRVIDKSTIYHEQGMYILCPNVTRTPAGDLLVTFLRAPHIGNAHHCNPLFEVQVRRSTDEGQTWGEPRLLVNNRLGGVKDFGINPLPDGSMFLHAASTELVPAEGEGAHGTHWISRPGKPFWIRSLDDGHTWSNPRQFPPVPGAVWGHPADHSGVSRSGLLALSDGRLLLPSKATDQPPERFRFFGILRISRDMGKTWEYGGRIAEDPVAHFSEPTIHQTPSGRILVLFRCHPFPPGGSNASVNFDTGISDDQYTNRLLALVYSDDEGATWSPWRPTAIHGSPGHMLGLRDGRIFVTVGTRWAGQRGCVARVVDPEGSDLDAAPELPIRSDSVSGDCGYPWSVELSDGRVLVVHWHHYADDHRGVEATVVEEV